MTYLETGLHNFEHIRCVNECESIAIASGYHLATGKTGVVYLQNSGLGKTVNPLTSLAHQKIYSIPILLLIGWRGEPGKPDAVQHQKMGPMTLELLQLLDISYEFLSTNSTDNNEIMKKAALELTREQKPFALIVRKGVFESAPLQSSKNIPTTQTSTPAEVAQLTREEAIETILSSALDDDIFVSSTGKISRELFKIREQNGQAHDNDFCNIGAMGCAQSIGLGIAQQQPNRRVIILDGDGALLMQLGAMVTAGQYSPKNFFHIILDNSAHDSTGGQMTFSGNIDLKKISEGSGYQAYYEASEQVVLQKLLNPYFQSQGPALFRVRVQKGAKDNLTRPPEKPTFYKALFMKKIMDM